MKIVRLGNLEIGRAPVLVATVLADTASGMLQGVSQALAAGADCVELRIDRLEDMSEVAHTICQVKMPHIVACRAPRFGGAFGGTEKERIARLVAAIEAGATGVDIEFFTEPHLRARVIDSARSHGIPVLVGYENMQETPPRDELIRGLDAVAKLKPDLIKLAVWARSYQDLLVILGVVLEARMLLDVPFAVIALGPYGAPSRPLACILGASFTYCAIASSSMPGQLTVKETRDILKILSKNRS